MTSVSADVIEGMREALRLCSGTTPGEWMFVRDDESCHQAIHAQHPHYPELAGKVLFLLVGDSAEAEVNAAFVIAARKAVLAALALPDSKPDQGGA